MAEAGYLSNDCPHCAGRIEFPEHGVGEWVECPHCRENIQLCQPSLGDSPPEMVGAAGVAPGGCQGDATFDKRILAQAEAIVVRMENAAKPHAAAAREILSRMSSGVDPTLIYHAAVVGSAKIARAGLTLAKFTDEMVTEFSEKIRPFIPEIWAKANEMIDDMKAPEPVTPTNRLKD